MSLVKPYARYYYRVGVTIVSWGRGQHCVTPARAVAKETSITTNLYELQIKAPVVT